MTADVQEQATFHLTGEMSGDELEDVAELGLRPALLAGYGDLPGLRYDYPLVMAEGGDDDAVLRSLSSIVDGVLQRIAPEGMEGERLRRDVLRLEEGIRRLVSGGARGSLSRLWELARDDLLAACGSGDEVVLRQNLKFARDALTLDGEVVDCDADAPTKLLTHLWSVVERGKADRALAEVERLVVKLSDILKADFMQSEDARTPETLERSVGPAYAAAFDFEAMSQILKTGSTNSALPAARRARIRAALSVLKLQRFFAPARCGEEERKGYHGFAFDSCGRASKAFEERLPELVALIRAMAIAELEIANHYRESRHDRFFERFGESALAPEDLAPFPSYLIRLRNGHHTATEKASVVEALSSGLPLKVVVQSDDILEDLPVVGGRFSFGVKGQQLPAMATGLNTAYVLQASAASLYPLRYRVADALAYQGPALFSIFSGAVRKALRSTRNVPGLPSYLRAAAATESRAFPTFTYDPAAGTDLAARFRVIDNPQAGAAWPVHRLNYEDEELQRQAAEVAFTFVDFVASDKRYARHLARVPRRDWQPDMMPVSEFLALDPGDVGNRVPYILMVDERNALHRVVVDAKLVEAARRCAAFWRSLQELGGIENSHARALLEKERAAWDEAKERELSALKSAPQPDAAAPTAAEAPATAEAPTPAPLEEPEETRSDEAFIETPRCTTCHECIEINNKMFAYDENMQAYIADLKAGSFRQLVEAAESCQVCIIHPGKPWNEDEPGLDELVSRAEAFN